MDDDASRLSGPRPGSGPRSWPRRTGRAPAAAGSTRPPDGASGPPRVGQQPPAAQRADVPARGQEPVQRGPRRPLPPGPSSRPVPAQRAAPVRIEPATTPVRTRDLDEPRTDLVPPVPAAEEPTTVAQVSPARRGPATAPRERSLGSALLATAAATIAPGSGHLLLGRRRNGGLILGVFLMAVVALLLVGLTSSRSSLLSNLLSTRMLVVIGIGTVVAALAWIAVIVRTYVLARPRGLGVGAKAVGLLVTAALCLAVAAPFGYAAKLANDSRSLLNTLFTGQGGGTAAAVAIAKPRLNVFLVGSDAGPDRTGARTDSMMVASIDTRTGRTTIFGLPRNLGHVQFPPGTPMAAKFPKGFHDDADNLSGDYILNAVYAWGLTHPADAPTGPTPDIGLNLLQQTVQYMLGIDIDYYVEANMAGFSSIVDALGGLQVDVGPNPIPIGGILPSGRHVKPDRYIAAGPQLLNGTDALAYARSRTDSTDYTRMGRQRCLLQNLLTQKSPADILTHFQEVATATTNAVSTNIPQEVLPSLVALAGQDTTKLESLAFDPSLADPDEPKGQFVTINVDVPFMRTVVQSAIDGRALPTAPATTAPGARTSAPNATGSDTDPEGGTAAAPTNAPVSLAASCG